MDRDPSWLAEQRYRAVLEVLDGAPISEVALRDGVSRQAVHKWRARYLERGIDGLKEASRHPHHSPTRLAGRAGGAGVRAAPRPSPLGCSADQP